MKIYIAGPMSDYENHNFDEFDKASRFIAQRGHVPISPADIDRLCEGYEKYPSPDAEFDRCDRIRILNRDLNAISGCDAIYFLEGWSGSKGARAEKAYAKFISTDEHPIMIMHQGYADSGWLLDSPVEGEL